MGLEEALGYVGEEIELTELRIRRLRERARSLEEEIRRVERELGLRAG